MHIIIQTLAAHPPPERVDNMLVEIRAALVEHAVGLVKDIERIIKKGWS